MNRSKNRNHLVRLITCIIWVLQLGSTCFIEAQNAALINEESFQKIEFPYQLTFLHEMPKNKVDSLLIELLSYEHHQENGILKYKLLESIAKTRTKEAFYLLFVGCSSKPKIDNYLPPFQQLCYTIKNNGGLGLLNNYFLKNPVMETGSERDFEREVISRCKKLNPKIYYYKNLPQEINMEVIQYEIEQFKKENIVCKSPQQLTKNNLRDVQNVYELTFLHEQPTNTVDSCVRYLTDSINWNLKRNWHQIYDSIWNRIAQTKSTEALQLLYLSSWDEVNPYNERLYILTNWVYSRVDKYFYKYYYTGKKLNIDSIGDFVFRKEVLKNIEKIAPKIHFCDQPTLFQLYTKHAESENLKVLDEQIIKIIRRNNKLHKKFNGQTIENEIRQLPFVKDVRYGDCYATSDVETKFAHLQIYTQLIDADKVIDRSYTLKTRRLFFLGVRIFCLRLGKIIRYRSRKWKYVKAYSYPALNQVKKYCEENKKRDYINLNSEK